MEENANSLSTQPNADRNQLKRSLSNRHIQLIAIGGAIGTGLFMGSGKTISLAGPSIIFVYMIIGFVLFFVMRAMGELLLSNLNYKSFSDFSADLIGPWAGFFVGWTYWFCWVITGIADIIAITSYVSFWVPDFPEWVTSFICVVTLLTLNLVSVRLFGELEFWFAMIKIVAIVALIAVGGTLIAMNFQSPTGHTASLSNIWNDGGMFPMGISGFFAGFQIAIFAFVGIELVGTAAAETRDPEKSLPKAINAIPIRIIAFYVLSLIVIMAVTPWRTILADKSPFVEMFVLISLPAAASIVNFVVLTSAASSANSGVFSTSRMLFGLSKEGDAPKQFSQLSKKAVPATGLIFTCICLSFGIVLIYFIPDIMHAFTLVTTVSAILFMFIWSMILYSYLNFRKKRPEMHKTSHYKMPAGIVMSWLSLAFFAFMVVLLAFQNDTRQALIATPVWFILLFIGYQFAKRRKNQ
ncbi:D-serine/D-alanine/glycine transporter [Providencia rettgeri]|uniref:D-serine/D-alanine/glycine transporter n=1 Tax=Providencia sp. M-8 TaxID=2713151 RepID=UPI00140C5108|nr:D-serine/D-alanine/glycine transporter [Providencia sp. M-8]